ncbi:PHO85 cyclin-5 [Entomortierella parvispora]|uniref:PHO85 cyclin-5 n=1 Tax=Entomortierella parvispora TaxID=205924 RepID=A0A9P3H749_9FUNG|nr:PHO85 cyclin-5 [Entomortierella parvispora]
MLTLQVCAATSTGTNFQPGGGLECPSVQAMSSFSTFQHQHQQQHSGRPSSMIRSSSVSCKLPSTTSTARNTSAQTQQQQQQQPQCPSRKRACPREEGEGYQDPREYLKHSSETTESSLQCPRLQSQQLCLPRKCTTAATTGAAPPSSNGSSGNGTHGGAQCALDPNTVKANFVDSLVDTAAIVIESIWPPSPECAQKQKGLPLRTFIQETLKRSRSSYSTLQTALFYLYKIRNKVPNTYLKRRQDQLHQSYPHLSAAAHHHHHHYHHSSSEALMTPPASPLHTQNLAEFASSLQGPDYFSLRAAADTKSVLPSPMSSTCSMTSASPASSTGFSPCSASSPASNTSSPTSSTSSPCSVSSTTSSSTSGSSNAQSSSSQSNRIIYCGRRTFLAALMVASKYLQDRNYSNKAWAKISGLSIKEINANELIFLKLIDYSLFVSHDTFMRWTALLVAHGQEATRKFMHAVDATQPSSFAARSLSMPPLVLNGSHIRYAPMKTDVIQALPLTGFEADGQHVDSDAVQESERSACATRCTKVARSMAYPSDQSGPIVASGSFVL